MAKPYFKEAAEKEFVKAIKGLCYGHELWRVWNDAVMMMALSISNAIDAKRRDKREEQYLSIIKTYTEQEINEFPKLFALVTLALEQNPDQDFLGKMFMQLELSNKWKGQFFTPFSVSKMMAEMQLHDAQELIERQGWISVCDPCVGAGAMLLAAVSTCREKNINYHDHVLFVGQDIDQMAALMAYIQLSLLGCPGYIKVGNSLTDPMTGPELFGEDSENMWFTPFYFKNTWHHRRTFAMLNALMKPTTKANITLDQPDGMFFFFFEDMENKRQGEVLNVHT